VKDQEYFYLPGLYNEWLDPETSQFVMTVAFGITDANYVMSQIHNSKKRMPAMLTEDLAWEWLMEKPSEERLTQIARTQIPSRLLDFCTVDRNYRSTLEATPLDYPGLPAINTSFINTEELQFNHWPADLEPVLHGEEEGAVVEQMAGAHYFAGTGNQGDLFS
jgi:hypothetical protein